MPLYLWMAEMPYDEFLGWLNFLERRPIGWREDLRTHKLLQVQGVKESADKVFPTIAQMKEHEEKEKAKLDSPDMGSFKQSMMFKKILGAKGGEVIPS